MEDIKIVTFDFDSTLWRWGFDPADGIFSRSCGPDPAALEELRVWVSRGASVHIVTSRGSSNRSEVDEFMHAHGDLVTGIHFTDGAWKGPALAELRSDLHHDDDPEELVHLEARTRGVLWTSGNVDEKNEVCNPEDSRFHFDNWH